MEDKYLIIISLIIFIFGTSLLLILLSTTNILEVKLKNLDNLKDDNIVKIRAKINKISELENIIIITASQTELIDIILFETKNFENGSLEIGDKIEIIGKLTEYKGKKEIIGEKIIKVHD